MVRSGSSSEIIRVLGGPSIGDLRSRLVRLIPLPQTNPAHSATSSPRGARPSDSPTLLKTPTVSGSKGRFLPLSPFSPPPPAPLAPPVPQSNLALHALLSYRLPTTGPTRDIKQEWLDILEGRHKLWKGIEHERKECIRGFLVHFESEILRRAHRNFNFRGGSVGNFFLAAGQKFFRSIQSSIFLFSAVSLINGANVAGQYGSTAVGAMVGAKVIPVINTNHTATIAAELRSGDVIVGQCEISHPVAPVTHQPKNISHSSTVRNRGGIDPATLKRLDTSWHSSPSASGQPGTPSSVIFDPFHSLSIGGGAGDGVGGDLTSGAGTPAVVGQSVHLQAKERERSRRMHTVGNTGDGLDPEDADVVPTALAEADGEAGAGECELEETGNIVFNKENDGEREEILPSPIERVFYVNAYRNEISAAPNPSYISSLAHARTLVYSCGSLWTSIVPCIALRGVATAIARSASLKHKVLLLNSKWDRETQGMTALDFIYALVSSLNSTDGDEVSRVLRDRGFSGAQLTGSDESDMEANTRTKADQGIHNRPPTPQHAWTAFAGKGYAARELVSCLVCLEGGRIPVETAEIEELGIRVIKVQGRAKKEGGVPMFTEQAIRKALHLVGKT
ncbi:hypothetical protein K437DRAFT_253831 [Tilletiaria anomala UBC 951]|uniref:Uncharacterized protein n=1 Tax=Tilletiaria anomala (strain ATCC 24038 / CBS 436.72 / UBC 951) TaxID=1037660 RepID=A0A066WG09_TILAU|nr:uncharacterized protein K437DRAFT_253831 [Tilletiaria anomala UBC 951]KDN52882.1 hypothetical protein K437DRAFT_253831 [Tilletiaria anomala UBC 951]